MDSMTPDETRDALRAAMASHAACVAHVAPASLDEYPADLVSAAVMACDPTILDQADDDSPRSGCLTTRERRERKAANLLRWADGNDTRGAARLNAGTSALDRIPFGQPIITGRGSRTAADRNYRERARRDVGAGFALIDKANHQRDRAASIAAAADGSIFSDDADAADALRARIAEREAERARIVAYNKTCRGKSPTRDRSLLDDAQRRELADLLRVAAWQCKGETFPAYALSNLSGRIKADRDRLARLEADAARRERADALAASGEAPARLPTFGQAPTAAAVAVMARMSFDGPCAFLAGRVDRDTYRETAAALGRIGGRWDKIRGGFLFVGPADAIVSHALAALETDGAPS